MRKTPFFLTKLAIPQTSPSLLVQTRALERLQRVPEYPLTLLNAPAGAGKTTLLAMWAATSQLPVAWVSLDADDSDPARFWSYLLMALETRLQGTMPGPLASSDAWLQKEQPRVAGQALAAFVNALKAVTTPLALALDDYHLLASNQPRLHEMVGLLLERLPPHVHLIVSSRAEPPLPLPRLRARGLLLELRGPDLRLTRPEAAAFLQARLGQFLPAELIDILYARTEGWAAGLQLAAIELQAPGNAASAASFSGRDRYVMDYFTEEALRHLPAALQLFLLQTSLLARLCAPLCDAVCGITQSQERLEMLERGNLFIEPLDQERQWYRYHPLFAETLRLRLEQTLPGRLPELHLRASRWFEAQSAPADAIRHAFAAQDAERAARLIESAASEAGRARQERPPLLAQRVEVHEADVMPRLEPLSQRELEVLRWLAEGASNQEIAEHLVIAVGTVKRHINTIFMKLGVQSRTQAIAIAHRRSLLAPARLRLVNGALLSALPESYLPAQ